MQCYDSVTVVRGLDDIGGRGGVSLDYCSRGGVKYYAGNLRWIGFHSENSRDKLTLKQRVGHA